MDRSDNEQARLATLAGYRVLDTPNEPELDQLVRLAAATAQVPIALISLVDANRCWFKARYGVEVAELPRVNSFCTHAIRGPDVFVVEDTTADSRFATSDLVNRPPNIRFYAGAPLKAPNGARIGTLCVLDTKTHKGLTGHQSKYLATLAERAITAFEGRLSAR